MASVSRLGSLLILAGLTCLPAARVRKNPRQQSVSTQPSKYGEEMLIQGIPVLNFQMLRQRHVQLDEWVVGLRRDVTEEEIETLCGTAKGACGLRGHPGSGGVAMVSLHGNEDALSSFLSQARGVAEYAETVPQAHKMEVASREEVGSASNFWGLARVGARPSGSTSGPATTGAGVHIYVFDTGVRTTHQDFTGRAVPTLDVTTGGGRTVECQGDVGCAGDRDGHGTHCAGTTAGKNSGVAPGAKVHAVKVLNDNGSGSFSWSYSALDWVASKGARPAVASMSLGGAGVSRAFEEAVTAAVEAGVTVVVAGGNSRTESCEFSPAFVPAAITVGATTSTDQKAGYSNFGACTDIWAPGSDILSASAGTDVGYTEKDGTSMACPHVSGGAALVLSANPLWSPEQVLSKLMATAERGAISLLESDDTNALLWVSADPAPVPAPTPAPAPVANCDNICFEYGSWVCSLYDFCKGCPFC